MKQDWQIKKLGEVCELSAGGDVPKDNFSKNKTEKYTIPIYANGEKREGLYGYTNIVKVQKPSITVSARGTIGFAVKRSKPFYPVVRLIVITPKDNSYLSLDFLHYILKKIDFKHSGTSIPQLTVPMIKDYKIPLPPLSEQKKIVEVLDQAFAGIEQSRQNTKQNLKNTKEIFESYLQLALTPPQGDALSPSNSDALSLSKWEEKKLGEIGIPKMCKRIFKEQTKTEGDIPFYKIGTFGKEPDAFISREIYDEFRSKYSFPKKGDVLISASGTIGRRVKYNGEPAYFQDSNIVWIDNNEEQVLNDFLFEFYGACNWGSTKGATISRLYNDNLKNINIVFPKSLKEQQSIVHQLDALRTETQKLEEIYAQKLNDLEELKKSLLQKAFAGELVK